MSFAEIRYTIQLLLISSLISYQSLFAQQFSSKDNYTGNWEAPTSWIPTWAAPQNVFSGIGITINGYITINSSLTFSNNSAFLIINDTLVIIGDLILKDHNVISINNNAVLIVRGNLKIDDHTIIMANGYLIVTGNVTKMKDIHHGSTTSVANPVKVFIGGTITPLKLTENNPETPVFNCTSPPTLPYSNTGCSYGNISDLANDPINPFFQSTCKIVTPIITAAGPTTFCEGGSVTLTSTAQTSYLWSNGATTPSIIAKTTGSYSVRVTNASGCQSISSAAITVNVNALPVVYAGLDATIPYGTSKTIDATVSGTGPFIYSWSPSSLLADPLTEDPTTVNLTSTTIYTLKATSSSTSCSNTGDVTITVSGGPLSANPQAFPSIICAGAKVKLHAMGSGGSGSYSYTWTSTPVGFTSSIANPEVNPIVSTSYNVAVFDGFNTINSHVDVIVNDLPATPSIAAGGPTTFCAGESVTLTSSANSAYLWSTGETTESIKVTKTGSYSVRVTSGTGCQSAESSAVPITVNALPVASISSEGPTIICDGDSITLTASEGKNYVWSDSSTGESIKIFSSGDYTVKVTDSTGCQSAESSIITVRVNTLPVPISGNNGPVCAGSALQLSCKPDGMTTYTWTGPGGFTSSLQNPSVSTHSTLAMSGKYVLTITDINGCINSDTTVSKVNMLPSATATNSGPACEGGDLYLNSQPSGMLAYSWTGPNGFTSLLQNPSALVNATPSMTGTYSVTVTDTAGCMATTATDIVVNALPEVSITSSSSPMCTNDMRTLTVNPPGGNFVVVDGLGSLSGNILSANGTGNIRLLYNYTGICSNSATQSIMVNDLPVANAGPDQELKFIFETQMNATLAPSETGEWSLVSGSGYIRDKNSPVTWISDLSTGENRFSWKVNNGSCEETAEVALTVFDLFVPSVITPNGDGKNDYFVIGECTGRVELIIFNRWGNEEYTSSNYENNWDGRNKKGTELPNDTYFYVLGFENGKTKKGSVLVMR